MLSNPNAETSAGNLSISNQGTVPRTPSPEQNIGRNPGDQGNTPPEESLNKPLTHEEKVEIIRAAIEEKYGIKMKHWGEFDLSRLINHYEKGGVTPNQWITFFTDLLFFIAKPEISSAFYRTLPDGLNKLSKLMNFFNELDVDFDEYNAWCAYRFIEYDDVITEFDFNNIAEAWLEGDDLQTVLGNVEGPGELKTLKDVKAAKQRQEPEEDEESIFSNDQEMVAALDRYFPREDWPADKFAIASQPDMKSRLENLEVRRIRETNETAEERKAREIKSAVNASLIMGPNFLGRSGDLEYDVNTNTKKPTGKTFEIPVSKLPLNLKPHIRDKKQPVSAKTRTSKKAGAVKTKKSASAPGKKPAPTKKTSKKKKS